MNTITNEKQVQDLSARLCRCAQGITLGAEGMGWSVDHAVILEAADALAIQAAKVAELEAAQPAALLPFSDALRIARGCTDYGGGYRGTEHYGAYQDGIKTVIASLEAAFRKGLSDPQVAALRAIGAQEEQAAPKPAQVSEPVALDSHNVMTAWTPELRDQRVSAKGFHSARAVIGTTSLDDDRIVYRALQAYLYAAQPAQVAAPTQADGWVMLDKRGLVHQERWWKCDFFGGIETREGFTPADVDNACREWPGLAPFTVVPVFLGAAPKLAGESDEQWIDRITGGKPAQVAAPERTAPLTTEQIEELEQASYVDGRRPVYRTDRWGDEVVDYEPTRYFNYFMLARAVERAHGIGLAAAPKREGGSDDE